MNLITSLPLYLYFFNNRLDRTWKWLILLALGITLYNACVDQHRAVILVAALTIGLCALRGLFRLSTAASPWCWPPRDGTSDPEPDLDRRRTPRSTPNPSPPTSRARLEYWSVPQS